MKTKKHATVAIFVPHAGCPQQCSFCDQRFISGAQEPPTDLQVREIVERAAKNMHEDAKPAQIAFFGGSFTAINSEYMVMLLQSVQIYLDNINFSGIRISTRPDAISEDVLKILKKYHVEDIELGAQSLDNSVLQANMRGHTAGDIIAASNLIRKYGFGLGLQIMTGLYTDDTETTINTVKEIINLKPDSARIYPTVVLRGTTLARLYEQDEYNPQTLEEAVELCAGLLELFTKAGVPVIRIGLHDSPELRQNIVAGPHHPAFRELCESRILLRKTLKIIGKNSINAGNITLAVAPDSISKMAGQKRENLKILADMGYFAKIRPESEAGYLQVEVL